MSKNHNPASQSSASTWSKDKLIDDIQFKEEDAKDFAQLLNAAESDTSEKNEMKPGTILKGKIVEITKDHVVVDVGLKSEGLVPIDEFSDPSEIILDNKIEVFLDQAENEDGQIVLSREKAERQRQWEYIQEHCEEGSIVKGRIIRKVKGGLMVDIGMEAFLPGSQIDNKRIRNLDEYIGQTFEFKILKINIERKNVVVSRRELLEAERLSKKTELLESIQEGETRTGVVKNITDFGVFLDLDGIDGLLHITDMAWKRVRHPSEMVELGQTLEIIILGVDREKGRVALGLKQKDANPWEEIEQKYPPGTRVTGRVVNLVGYGAFVEIEPGIEGLVHISEMSWDRSIDNPNKLVNVGDEVEAVVQAVQRDEGKISLSIKQTEPNPWDNVEEQFPVEAIIEGNIRSITNYGIFVELTEGIQGMVHISDLSWTKKYSHPSEYLEQMGLEKGDTIKTQIVATDHASQKITLGIKQLSPDPWEFIEKNMEVGSLITGKVKKITAFGAFIDLQDDLEGLIHVTELSDEPFTKVEDILSVEQEIQARVKSVDPEHKKIALSLKTQSNQDDIVVGSAEETAGAEETAEAEAGVEAEAEETAGETQEQES